MKDNVLRLLRIRKAQLKEERVIILEEIKLLSERL